MRVLGIDPGTAIVGYSIIDYENGKYTTLDYGCIFTDKSEDMPVRLEQIYDALEKIIKLWKPTDMAIENLFFFKNQKTIIEVGQARGVITLVGQKNRLVKLILKLDEIPKPDDAADALAIAITHVNSKIGFGGFERGDNVTKKLDTLKTDRIKLSDYKKLMNIK